MKPGAKIPKYKEEAPAAGRRAWTDAYQVGQRVVVEGMVGKVVAIVPAQADLRVTAPDLWRDLCWPRDQRPPWRIRPLAAMARLVVALDRRPSWLAEYPGLRVVAKVSALKDPR